MQRFAPLEDLSPVEEMLPHISFLGGLSKAQLRKVAANLETARFKKGEYIARRGDEPAYIFIIRSGSVNLIIEDDDVHVTKRTFKRSDCFGEAALLSLVNNSASFVAAEDSELIAFSRKALNRLHREEPDTFCLLILNLARDLARKLQYTDEFLLHDDHHSAHLRSSRRDQAS